MLSPQANSVKLCMGGGCYLVLYPLRVYEVDASSDFEYPNGRWSVKAARAFRTGADRQELRSVVRRISTIVQSTRVHVHSGR